MSRTYTHTFKDGRKQDYDYKDIIDRAGQFYKNGSGSLDEVTRAGLEYIAQGNDPQYARLAQIGLSHWNNPEAVKNAYYDYNKKNGIEETPPTTTPPTSKPTTSGEGKDWSSIINKISAAYGKTGESVKRKAETNLAAIDEQERFAIELAKQQRDEAVKRAYALNDQSQVTYGQNAERLAQMGLTNAGYGDYLTGVAYGNLVGGVERANVNADNAVRDAYYAAGQAKSQVYDTMHNELADAEKAYKSTLASIVTAVSSGEINEEQAKAIANAYGITEDEALSLIGDAANAYKDTSNEGSIAVDPNTTNTDIDNTPDLTEEEKTAAKAERDKKIVDSVKELVKTSATTGAIQEVENLKDDISQDAYQEAYFHNALALIDSYVERGIYEGVEKALSNYRDGGQLNHEDYNNLMSYFEKAKTNRDEAMARKKNGTTRVALTSPSFLDALMLGQDSSGYITIGGTSYNVNLSRTYYEGGTLKDVEATTGTVAKENGIYYIYTNGKKWRKIQELGTSPEIFALIDKQLAGPQSNIAKPKHTKST